MRLIFKTYRTGKEKGAEKNTRMDFMVNTFHDLVRKLKEKENELHELKRCAEERAEHVENYNENILQSVPSGVISFDNDLRVTSVNTAAERILAIKADQCIGKPYNDIFHDHISDMILRNDRLAREEVVYESPRHKRLWLGLNISPLKDKSGSPIGKIIIFTDLTDLKALESQIRLRENLSSLGEMSAGIAHELRNPMGVIAGHTRILSKKAPEELAGNIDAINREIGMMDRIITDFMSFAHPLNVNRTVFDISSMVEELARTAISEDSKINLSLSFDRCLIEGDETLLRQVFTNLIQNAIEAMKDRGKLSIDIGKSASSVIIKIADSGHGISGKIKDKVFLPFYTTKEKGTGLGLAIVHKIVIAHGGDISFDSKPDGTVFRIILPCPEKSS